MKWEQNETKCENGCEHKPERIYQFSSASNAVRSRSELREQTLDLMKKNNPSYTSEFHTLLWTQIIGKNSFSFQDLHQFRSFEGRWIIEDFQWKENLKSKQQ